MKLVKIMYMGDGKTPNANGRIYSPEIMDHIVEKINSKGDIPVLKNEPLGQVIKIENIIGTVKNAKKTERGIECEIEAFRDIDLQKQGFLSPTGVGNLDGTIILNYDLVSIGVSVTPAFYHTLNFDDLDFEEIMPFVENVENEGDIQFDLKACVLKWAVSKGYQMSKEQINQIIAVVKELK